MNIQGAANPVPWRPQSAPTPEISRPEGPTKSGKFDPSSGAPGSTTASRAAETVHGVGTDSHRVNNRTESFFGVGHHSKVMADFEKFWADGATKDKEFAAKGMDETHPVVREYRRDRMETLFGFQTKIMNSTLQIEMASKLVEHATTGTRTILQTQA